jgi:polysaccharide biosynthesis/export protein
MNNTRERLHNMKKIIPIITIAFLLLSSCTSYKELIYLKGLAEATGDTTLAREKSFYQLQRGDILYIRIITNNPEIDQLFNTNMGMGIGNNQNMMVQQQQNMFGGGMLYFQGYSIDDSGYVDLPVIDKIYTLGKTTDEVKSEIEKKLFEYLEEALVIVKLDQFKVTFLGEFRNPQVLKLQQNKLTIMEALGHVGGISYSGNHKDLMVIRPLETGSRVYRLDMTNKHIIESQEFELLPNDVVYVAPRRNTWLKNEASQSFTFWLSTISTSMSTILLIVSLSR